MGKKNIGGCDHIGLLVKDALKSADFYAKYFGFIKKEEVVLGKDMAVRIFGIACDLKFVKLESDSIRIELFQPLSKSLGIRTAETSGYHHWGYCVEDRGKFSAQLKKQGIEVIEIEKETHTVYFAKDPEGNLIEIRD